MLKKNMLAVALMVCLAPVALHAQAPARSTMRDQLMPATAAVVVSAPMVQPATPNAAAQPSAAAYRSSGTPYMIAGAALFAAGIIAGGGAGTVLVLAGAGIGAYGLYLHFR